MARERKPEVLLEDVFKSLKPALLYYKAGKKDDYSIAMLDYALKIKVRLPKVFHLTKPFTGITKKDAENLFDSYWKIKRFRRKRKKVEKPCKGERLFPLSPEKYQEVAYRIYRRNGQPTFGIRRVDKVIFGDPVTLFSNYIEGKSYSNQTIIKRYIGVRPVRSPNGIVRLYATIDVEAEGRLKQRRY